METINKLLELIKKYSENFLEPDEVRLILYGDGSGRFEYMSNINIFDFENIDDLLKKLVQL